MDGDALADGDVLPGLVQFLALLFGLVADGCPDLVGCVFEVPGQFPGVEVDGEGFAGVEEGG